MNQACVIDSEPASITAAMWGDVLNDEAITQNLEGVVHNYSKTMNGLSPLETVQDCSWLNNIQSVCSWEEVIDIYIYIKVVARCLASREDTDAERIHTVLREHCSKIMLRKVAPWIVDQGGWDDFIRYLLEDTDEAEEPKQSTWAAKRLLSLILFGCIGSLAILVVKSQRNI